MKKRIISKKVVQQQSEPEDIQVMTQAPQESVTVKIKRNGPYACWGIEVSKTVPVPEDGDSDQILMDLIDSLTSKVQEYSESEYVQSIEIADVVEEEIDYDNQAPPTGEYDAPEASGEQVEEGITEDEIREMDKKSLLAFIKENGIDVDPKEFKKVADLAEAVIEALSDGGEEVTDDGEGADDSGEETTEDDIREMDRETLIDFIKENDLGVNPKEYKKTSDLADAVIEQISSSDLTSEEVLEMTKAELLELIKEQDLSVDPKKFKKLADLAQAVVDELFEEGTGEEDFGDFDSTDFGEE
jgi:hypothetical protein